MPYKDKNLTHDITCPICGNVYTIKHPAYMHKLKSSDQYRYYCKSCRTKIAINNMNDAKKKEIHDNLVAAHKKYYDGLSDEEKLELKNKRKEGNKKYWDNLSNEDRVSISIKRRNDAIAKWNTLDDTTRKSIGDKISKSRKNKFNNMSVEEYAEYVKYRQEIHNNWYNGLSDEQRDKICNTLSNNSRKYWGNITDDELQERKLRMKQISDNMWKNMDDNTRKNRAIIIGNKLHDRWNNLTNEDKNIVINHMSRIATEYWNSLSDNERNAISQHRKEIWSNMDENKKKNMIRKCIIEANGKNQFHQKFEKRFNESHLINSYHLIPEVILSNNNVIHSWDYGIYDNDNNLVMVVDLDGAYYHADICDYDGIHSKEEYDEKRSLSVPNDIKIFIIIENKFNKCFDELVKLLILNYDQYIQYIFNMCRNMPFPTPKYTGIELLKAYNKLLQLDPTAKYVNAQLNTRIGDRLINHFHESIYIAHRANELSPYDAWYNDELLMKVIKNRIIYQSYLNPNKILQGFNISKIAQKVSVFSASRAKLLISKYLSDCNIIYDPFSGFSGRMLGTISLGKTYIGSDISPIHVNESNKMIQWFHDNNIDCNATVMQSNIYDNYGDYECLFTCPPYSDKEQWLDVPVSTNTCDDWIDICLSHFKCKKYLFVVDNTDKYKDYVVDTIENRSHLNNNNEYVILL